MIMRRLIPLALALVSAHYEDPNLPAGCASDEQAIQITGLAGDFCSPQCDASGSCPSDVLPGVTATPTCALHSSGGAKFCALVCDPTVSGKQCGVHASCKPIQGTGLCTYDDIPAPPSSEHWAPVKSPTFEAQSVCISVAFEPTGRIGWAGAGTNGAGVSVIKTEDRGETWATAWPTNMSSPSINMLLASASASATSVVVAGVLVPLYTTDGTDFRASTNGFLSPAQDAQTLPDGRFALVTQSAASGVAISPDGKAWTHHPTGLNLTKYPARYGAFPSATTWYLTAGTWPEQLGSRPPSRAASTEVAGGSGVAQVHRLSRHATIRGGRAELHLAPRARARANASAGYYAAIAKTTDGGRTWRTVYVNDGGGLYPNGIHCATSTHCVAALEGERAAILVTRDGGQSWKRALDDPDPHSSLMYARMLSPTEGWVTGGHMSRSAFEGRFWHTTDGGDTWRKEAIPGLYVISADLVSPSAGYAVALTLQSGLQLLRYRKPKMATALAA